MVQEAYVRAFAALADFRGDASLVTWLARIVLNEALQRRRRRTALPLAEGDPPRLPQAEVIPFPSSTRPLSAPSSNDSASRWNAPDDLPEHFRFLVARTIEGMSVEDTAELLGIRPETVKTRLHRARNRAALQ